MDMTREEIVELIEAIVRKYEGHDDWLIERRETPLPEPSAQDWAALEAKFQCRFPPAFVDFMSAMSAYRSPGLLEVADRKHPLENEPIAAVYDHEMEYGTWDREMVPFDNCSGSGDFYCLSAAAGETSGVFVVEHEMPPGEQVRAVASSFEEWLRNIEEHLGGELAAMPADRAIMLALDRQTRGRLRSALSVSSQWFPSLFRK
jgi:hypothetical protein